MTAAMIGIYPASTQIGGDARGSNHGNREGDS